MRPLRGDSENATKIMVNKGKIKNIVFDFGGVILNIDFALSVQAFQLLGINDFGMLYSQHMQNELFNKLETGTISPDDFRHELRDITGVYMLDSEIDEAWNALLLDLPAYRIRMLEKVRNHYRIFLLSNSNVIHYQSYISILKKEHGYRSFDELFRKAYFSQNIGFRKPGEEIFRYVLDEQKIDASETLFIDDSFPNIETAERLGFITHFLDLKAGQDVSWLFSQDGILRFYDEE